VDGSAPQTTAMTRGSQGQLAQAGPFVGSCPDLGPTTDDDQLCALIRDAELPDGLMKTFQG